MDGQTTHKQYTPRIVGIPNKYIDKVISETGVSWHFKDD